MSAVSIPNEPSRANADVARLMWLIVAVLWPVALLNYLDRQMLAFDAGDFATARAEQFRSCRLVQTLAGYGYMGAAKATMKMLGVDVGPARLPHTNLSAEQETMLRGELESLGFFDWIKL
jgi:dihydrodipicolinate synthase/N-acetylneuraminate lyase